MRKGERSRFQWSVVESSPSDQRVRERDRGGESSKMTVPRLLTTTRLRSVIMYEQYIWAHAGTVVPTALYGTHGFLSSPPLCLAHLTPS